MRIGLLLANQVSRSPVYITQTTINLFHLIRTSPAIIFFPASQSTGLTYTKNTKILLGITTSSVEDWPRYLLYS